MTYATDILKPASRKTVRATAIFRKHFFGWTLSGTAGIWYQSTTEEVQSFSENDAEATETFTFAALVTLTVTAVGGWFWDEPAKLLYYKAITGSTAFENFSVAEIVFRWAQFPGADDEGNVYDSKILSAPALKLAVSQIFESKAGQIGSGSLGVETTDNLFSRLDFEPDGQIDISETIS